MAEPKTITLDDLSQTYADVRMEFNKLVSIDHPHIVKCIGFSIISMAFVLELAPLGSLKTIMNDYRSSGYYLCPNSLIDTIKQVIFVDVTICYGMKLLGTGHIFTSDRVFSCCRI